MTCPSCGVDYPPELLKLTDCAICVLERRNAITGRRDANFPPSIEAEAWRQQAERHRIEAGYEPD